MIAARYWLALCAMVVVANAGQPADPPPPPQSTSAEEPEPDEEFIEFLGADDHGDDAAWRELLKNAPSGKQNPAAPPADSKQ